MKRTLLILALLLTCYQVSSQVTLNQVDDFEDGSRENWRIGSAGDATVGPINVATGGPAGVDDNFLQYTSNGTPFMPASRMVFFTSNNQWSGDYIAAGVDEITFDVRVLTNDLNIRIAMQGSGDRICTTNAINVPAGSGWTSITIPIAPGDFTLVNGSGPITDVLNNVMTVRILSSSAPTWDDPDEIEAIIQVDNITATSSLSTSEATSVTKDFTITPNPSKSKLNVTLPVNSGDMKLEVFDVLGKRVYHGTITNLESSVDASGWKSGVYLVRVSNDEITQTKRFIKQ